MPQGGGIAVDFLALSGTGQHVTDLQPADVSIKVGGKQRTVSSLRYTKVDSGGSAPVSALPPPFAVNTAATGRNLLILIDNESLKVGTERSIRESLDQVLSQLGPADRVAFSVAPRDSVQLGFGAGLAAVRAAVAQFAGIKPATVTDAENACRSRDSLVHAAIAHGGTGRIRSSDIGHLHRGRPGAAGLHHRQQEQRCQHQRGSALRGTD